jgi:hypothetical protein
LLIYDKEYFLPFEKFPWFRAATVGAIHNVELLNEESLRWPELDVELTLESIGDPEGFPVIFK